MLDMFPNFEILGYVLSGRFGWNSITNKANYYATAAKFQQYSTEFKLCKLICNM